MADGQCGEHLIQRAILPGLCHPVSLRADAGVQPVVFPAVHGDHLHVLLDCSDGGHEPVAVETVGVQLIRRQVRGADHDYALFKHHLKQASENDCVADVIDEQLVETQHAHLLAQLPGQCLERVGGAGQLE
ncbi:hypothetical protein D3C81_1445030 [compost metagenome]